MSKTSVEDWNVKIWIFWIGLINIELEENMMNDAEKEYI